MTGHTTFGNGPLTTETGAVGGGRMLNLSEFMWWAPTTRLKSTPATATELW